MKNSIALTILLSLGVLSIFSFSPTPKYTMKDVNNTIEIVEDNSKIDSTNVNEDSQRKIYLGLLLDTSNSMDGLIDQAKSQLWNIVDELANAEHNGKPAELHIALYEYGNDNLSIRSGYVRQVSAFTQDLDEISTQLFKLTTRGGSEYCGTVINAALENLSWSENPEDMRMMFIAGNEPFNQGDTDFKAVCKMAAENNITVNTIFCGNYNHGINVLWEKGAEIGLGEYMNIDMDQKTVFVQSPYDTSIDSLNSALNKTYLAYGKQGLYRKEKQVQEDNNAAQYGQANKIKRAISKSKHVYKNEQWDLIDAAKDDKFDISKVEEKELPKEMKGMSLSEKEKYLTGKYRERKQLQKEIQDLAIKRKKYVRQVNDSLSSENELESAILRSIKTRAAKKSFTFKE